MSSKRPSNPTFSVAKGLTILHSHANIPIHMRVVVFQHEKHTIQSMLAALKSISTTNIDLIIFPEHCLLVEPLNQEEIYSSTKLALEVLCDWCKTTRTYLLLGSIDEIKLPSTTEQSPAHPPKTLNDVNTNNSLSIQSSPRGKASNFFSPHGRSGTEEGREFNEARKGMTKYYQTCVVISNEGKVVATHRNTAPTSQMYDAGEGCVFVHTEFGVFGIMFYSEMFDVGYMKRMVETREGGMSLVKIVVVASAMNFGRKWGTLTNDSGEWRRFAMRHSFDHVLYLRETSRLWMIGIIFCSVPLLGGIGVSGYFAPNCTFLTMNSNTCHCSFRVSDNDLHLVRRTVLFRNMLPEEAFEIFASNLLHRSLAAQKNGNNEKYPFSNEDKQFFENVKSNLHRKYFNEVLLNLTMYYIRCTNYREFCTSNDNALSLYFHYKNFISNARANIRVLLDLLEGGKSYYKKRRRALKEHKTHIQQSFKNIYLTHGKQKVPTILIDLQSNWLSPTIHSSLLLQNHVGINTWVSTTLSSTLKNHFFFINSPFENSSTQFHWVDILHPNISSLEKEYEPDKHFSDVEKYFPFSHPTGFSFPSVCISPSFFYLSHCLRPYCTTSIILRHSNLFQVESYDPSINSRIENEFTNLQDRLLQEANTSKTMSELTIPTSYLGWKQTEANQASTLKQKEERPNPLLQEYPQLDLWVDSEIWRTRSRLKFFPLPLTLLSFTPFTSAAQESLSKLLNTAPEKKSLSHQRRGESRKSTGGEVKTADPLMAENECKKRLLSLFCSSNPFFNKDIVYQQQHLFDKLLSPSMDKRKGHLLGFPDLLQVNVLPEMKSVLNNMLPYDEEENGTVPLGSHVFLSSAPPKELPFHPLSIHHQQWMQQILRQVPSHQQEEGELFDHHKYQMLSTASQQQQILFDFIQNIHPQDIDSAISHRAALVSSNSKKNEVLILENGVVDKSLQINHNEVLMLLFGFFDGVETDNSEMHWRKIQQAYDKQDIEKNAAVLERGVRMAKEKKDELLSENWNSSSYISSPIYSPRFLNNSGVEQSNTDGSVSKKSEVEKTVPQETKIVSKSALKKTVKCLSGGAADLQSYYESAVARGIDQKLAKGVYMAHDLLSCALLISNLNIYSIFSCSSASVLQSVLKLFPCGNLSTLWKEKLSNVCDVYALLSPWVSVGTAMSPTVLRAYYPYMDPNRVYNIWRETFLVLRGEKAATEEKTEVGKKMEDEGKKQERTRAEGVISHVHFVTNEVFLFIYMSAVVVVCTDEKLLDVFPLGGTVRLSLLHQRLREVKYERDEKEERKRANLSSKVRVPLEGIEEDEEGEREEEKSDIDLEGEEEKKDRKKKPRNHFLKLLNQQKYKRQDVVSVHVMRWGLCTSKWQLEKSSWGGPTPPIPKPSLHTPPLSPTSPRKENWKRGEEVKSKLETREGKSQPSFFLPNGSVLALMTVSGELRLFPLCSPLSPLFMDLSLQKRNAVTGKKWAGKKKRSAHEMYQNTILGNESETDDDTLVGLAYDIVYKTRRPAGSNLKKSETDNKLKEDVQKEEEEAKSPNTEESDSSKKNDEEIDDSPISNRKRTVVSRIERRWRVQSCVFKSHWKMLECIVSYGDGTVTIWHCYFDEKPNAIPISTIHMPFQVHSICDLGAPTNCKRLLEESNNFFSTATKNIQEQLVDLRESDKQLAVSGSKGPSEALGSFEEKDKDIGGVKFVEHLVDIMRQFGKSLLEIDKSGSPSSLKKDDDSDEDDWSLQDAWIWDRDREGKSNGMGGESDKKIQYEFQLYQKTLSEEEESESDENFSDVSTSSLESKENDSDEEVELKELESITPMTFSLERSPEERKDYSTKILRTLVYPLYHNRMRSRRPKKREQVPMHLSVLLHVLITLKTMMQQKYSLHETNEKEEKREHHSHLPSGNGHNFGTQLLSPHSNQPSRASSPRLLSTAKNSSRSPSERLLPASHENYRSLSPKDRTSQGVLSPLQNATASVPRSYREYHRKKHETSSSKKARLSQEFVSSLQSCIDIFAARSSPSSCLSTNASHAALYPKRLIQQLSGAISSILITEKIKLQKITLRRQLLDQIVSNQQDFFSSSDNSLDSLLPKSRIDRIHNLLVSNCREPTVTNFVGWTGPSLFQSHLTTQLLHSTTLSLLLKERKTRIHIRNIADTWSMYSNDNPDDCVVPWGLLTASLQSINAGQFHLEAKFENQKLAQLNKVIDSPIKFLRYANQEQDKSSGDGTNEEDGKSNKDGGNFERKRYEKIMRYDRSGIRGAIAIGAVGSMEATTDIIKKKRASESVRSSVRSFRSIRSLRSMMNREIRRAAYDSISGSSISGSSVRDYQSKKRGKMDVKSLKKDQRSLKKYERKENGGDHSSDTSSLSEGRIIYGLQGKTANESHAVKKLPKLPKAVPGMSNGFFTSSSIHFTPSLHTASSTQHPCALSVNRLRYEKTKDIVHGLLKEQVTQPLPLKNAVSTRVALPLVPSNGISHYSASLFDSSSVAYTVDTDHPYSRNQDTASVSENDQEIDFNDEIGFQDDNSSQSSFLSSEHSSDSGNQNIIHQLLLRLPKSSKTKRLKTALEIGVKLISLIHLKKGKFPAHVMEEVKKRLLNVAVEERDSMDSSRSKSRRERKSSNFAEDNSMENASKQRSEMNDNDPVILFLQSLNKDARELYYELIDPLVMFWEQYGHKQVSLADNETIRAKTVGSSVLDQKGEDKSDRTGDSLMEVSKLRQNSLGEKVIPSLSASSLLSSRFSERSENHQWNLTSNSPARSFELSLPFGDSWKPYSNAAERRRGGLESYLSPKTVEVPLQKYKEAANARHRDQAILTQVSSNIQELFSLSLFRSNPLSQDVYMEERSLSPKNYANPGGGTPRGVKKKIRNNEESMQEINERLFSRETISKRISGFMSLSFVHANKMVLSLRKIKELQKKKLEEQRRKIQEAHLFLKKPSASVWEESKGNLPIDNGETSRESESEKTKARSGEKPERGTGEDEKDGRTRPTKKEGVNHFKDIPSEILEILQDESKSTRQKEIAWLSLIDYQSLARSRSWACVGENGEVAIVRAYGYTTDNNLHGKDEQIEYDLSIDYVSHDISDMRGTLTSTKSWKGKGGEVSLEVRQREAIQRQNEILLLEGLPSKTLLGSTDEGEERRKRRGGGDLQEPSRNVSCVSNGKQLFIVFGDGRGYDLTFVEDSKAILGRRGRQMDEKDAGGYEEGNGRKESFGEKKASTIIPFDLLFAPQKAKLIVNQLDQLFSH